MEVYREYFGNVFFTILAIAAVVPAIMVTLTQNIVRAACWLLVSLAGAAGMFFILGADFVGTIQLLIYVGGTLVLVIFGVMLTATGPFVNLRSGGGDWAMAVVAGGAIFSLLAYSLLSGPLWSDKALFPGRDVFARHEPTTNLMGMAFLGFTPERESVPSDPSVKNINPPVPAAVGYLLPFEAVSLHLVTVLIGAAYLARAKRRRAEEA